MPPAAPRQKHKPVFSEEWQREQLAMRGEIPSQAARLAAAPKGGVTANLTARERKIAEFYKREGFQRPYLMVAAVKNALVGKVESPYATGAALVSMETGNGKMIFGCDWGPGVAFCHEPVTRAKVDSILRTGKANGVGAVQLTFIPFVQEADRAGGAHRYYPNVLTGFRILARNEAVSGSLRTAFRQYNGSGAAAERYATTAMSKRAEYVKKLERALEQAQSPAERRVRTVQADLLAMGFKQVGRVDGNAGPATRGAVREFKRMCVRHRFKRIDGSIGEETAKVIHKHRTVHKGKVSKHFSFREFASVTTSCKGNGHIRGHRDLIIGLEKIREKTGRPIRIVNGYRDPSKNSCVGGASKSQHLFGLAADCDPGLSVSQIRELRCFSGIGFSQSSGRVLHVDVRHVDRSSNVTGGTIANPTVWRYA
jgi:zinc D-Ala-D-Ala carboxypeptidase